MQISNYVAHLKLMECYMSVIVRLKNFVSTKGLFESLLPNLCRKRKKLRFQNESIVVVLGQIPRHLSALPIRMTAATLQEG